MSLYDQIKSFYPNISDAEFDVFGSIKLRNDSDGFGDYIEKWDYDQPIPEGLSLGKPTA